MTDWATNLPPGTRLADVSDRDRRDEDEDDAYWESLWDHASRFEEENRRDGYE